MVHICFPDIEIGDYYYCGTVLRSVQKLSNGQYYIMEFELQNEEDDSDTYEWNVYQCVVDNNTDADIYGADMNTITGRAPLETFGAAKRALNELLDYLKDGNYGEVTYIVPKFEDRQKYDLVEILPSLGVDDIFIPNIADLSQMGAGGCFVGKAIHEAGIKVDNKGVEAAAYTIIEVDKAMPTGITMYLDHPFAYSISESNGLPLFVGVVNKLQDEE